MDAPILDRDQRIARLAAKLQLETDPSDVRARLAAGARFLLVDVRDDAAWAHGRVPGALHMPVRSIDRRAAEIPPDTPLVVYCWGPGCNGSTKAALAFTRLGHDVREMIGGYEYWVREGFPVETDAGTSAGPPDHLTVTAAACGC